MVHFLSVTSCDSVLLTRLEGLKQLSRQLHDNRNQIRQLLRESHRETPTRCGGQRDAERDWDVLLSSADGVHSLLVELLLRLLQLCKLALLQPGGGGILGRKPESTAAPPSAR